MNHSLHNRLLPAAFFFIVAAGCFGSAAAAEDKPRVIVMTDISNEPDDEESLVRFLV